MSNPIDITAGDAAAVEALAFDILFACAIVETHEGLPARRKRTGRRAAATREDWTLQLLEHIRQVTSRHLAAARELHA